MQKLFIPPTPLTPEIHFSPKDNLFIMRGTSAPEDVRALYYPVIEWIKNFADDIIEGKTQQFSASSPIKMEADLDYFNSSSAKFLYDIFSEMKRLNDSGIPVLVDWFFDQEDQDMKEAGADIAALVGMQFRYVEKPSAEQ
jgi:hypothetical protein